MRWPSPIHARLDALVKCAEEVGEVTNRAELVAALVLAADEDGKRLSDAVRRLRQATVEDTLLEKQRRSAGAVIELDARRPGRRPAR